MKRKRLLDLYCGEGGCSMGYHRAGFDVTGVDKDWGNRELIYENKGFVVERFVRWKWFFRFLQAKEQIKTPKQLIQIETISYVNPDRDKLLLKVLNNKLIDAKRDRTKAQFSIEAGKKMKSETSLFSFDDDPDYLKALEYLSKKQQIISELEAEIAQLSSNPCYNSTQSTT